MNNNQNTLVTEKDITASIEPLLLEYFSGKVTAEGNKIIFTSEGGQTFKISVTEI